MAAYRREPQLSHRTQHRNALATGRAGQLIERCPYGARIRVVCIVDDRSAAATLPDHAHLRTTHTLYSNSCVLRRNSANSPSGDRQHCIPEVMSTSEGNLDLGPIELEHATAFIID